MSQYNLGNCYANGWGVAVDARKATYWFNRALRSGVQQAVGRLQHFGLPVLDDEDLEELALSPEEVYAQHLAAAEAGDAEEMDTVAVLLLIGQGVKADPEAAMVWLERALQAGSPSAMVTKGNLLAGFFKSTANTVAVDGPAALAMFDKAEAAGKDCSLQRAEIAMKGIGGAPRDAALCVKILQEIFARSHVIPQYKAAADLFAATTGHHEAGSKAASDAAVAAGRPFEMSVEHIREAHLNYALLYDFGFGVAENKDIAKRHYSSAADRQPLAKARMSELEAIEDASKGPVTYPADQGDGPFRAGIRMKPDGTPEFIIKGPDDLSEEGILATYRELAEDKEMEEAQVFLGLAYENGSLGLAKDLERARSLYAAAAKKGLWWAEQAVARLQG